VNAIVGFLLNDARILEYLMNKHMKEYTALIENRALKDEYKMIENRELNAKNEMVENRESNTNVLKKLMDENYLLKFNINRAHRLAGTKSPLRLNWHASYQDAEGGKMRRGLVCKSRRRGRGHGLVCNSRRRGRGGLVCKSRRGRRSGGLVCKSRRRGRVGVINSARL
jgi:hypothetical protein